MLVRNLLLSKEVHGAPDSALIVRIPSAGNRQLRCLPMYGDEEATLDSGTLAGQERVWDAAFVLADEMLERHMDALKGGAHVVELGCGLGMPAMVCAALGARSVLTDVPKVLPFLERGIEANFGRDGTGGGPGSAKAVGLEWDALAAEILMLQEGRFDFVLCSDCVYEAYYGETWRDLAESIDALSDEGTTVLIAMQRRDDKGMDNFLTFLGKNFRMAQLCERKGLSGVVEVYSGRRRRPRELLDLSEPPDADARADPNLTTGS